MKKYLAGIGVVLGFVVLIGGVKASQIAALMAMGESMMMPPTVVSSVLVSEQEWDQTLESVGTLEAKQGVVVSADVPGRVTEILFSAGSEVKKGDALIRQDTSSERAQLRAAEAGVLLAKANLDRVGSLLKKSVSSQAEYDTASARYKEAVAVADNIRTTIDKKTVKAPFDGRLGIRLVNVGSDLASGTPIVSLQAIDPIMVNFSLPQRQISKIAVGLPITLTSDAVNGEIFSGTVSVVNPEVDIVTRSVRVQATLENQNKKLLPGMFAKVEVILPQKKKVLAVPSTAISFATFGDSVYVIEESSASEEKAAGLTLKQKFVRIGEERGDFISIEKGIEANEKIVGNGVFKLHNGMSVVINNEALPEFQLSPTPEDS